MPLTDKQREYVVTAAADLLRHRQRNRLLKILQARLEHDDYGDVDERELDRTVLAFYRPIGSRPRRARVGQLA